MYTTQLIIPDEESCTTESTSRSNSIEEDNNSDNRDDDGDDSESMYQSSDEVPMVNDKFPDLLLIQSLMGLTKNLKWLHKRKLGVWMHLF